MYPTAILLFSLYLVALIAAVPIAKIAGVEDSAELTTQTLLKSTGSTTESADTDEGDDEEEDFTEPRPVQIGISFNNDIPHYVVPYNFGKDWAAYNGLKSFGNANTNTGDNMKVRKWKKVTSAASEDDASDDSVQHIEVDEPLRSPDLPIFDRTLLLKMRKQGLRLHNV